MIRNAIQIVGDLGRVDDDVDCRGEGEEEMAQLDDDLAPQWLCGHLAIAQHVVRLIQVDEGLRGVADHQHHHHPCEEGHHGTIPPAVCCMTGYCSVGSPHLFTVDMLLCLLVAAVMALTTFMLRKVRRKMGRMPE